MNIVISVVGKVAITLEEDELDALARSFGGETDAVRKKIIKLNEVVKSFSAGVEEINV